MNLAPAPAGLRPEEVALLVSELAPSLIGARIEKVVDYAPGPASEAFVLRLSKAKERFELMFTVRAGYCRVHLLPDKAPAAARPSDKAMALRELLRGGIVESIDQPQGDRVFRLVVTLHREGQGLRRALILELFGNRGRGVVVDRDRRRIRWAVGRGGVEINRDYRYPEPPPKKPSDFATLPFEPTRLIPDDARGTPHAFNFALSRHMAECERVGDFELSRDRASRRVRDEVKKQRRLLSHLGGDLGEAEQWQKYEQRGELVKAELHRLSRGDTSVEVINYFDPEMPKIEIPLDPKLTPVENVERCFRRARKGKRSVSQVEERRDRCQSVIDRLVEVGQQLSELNLESGLHPEAIIKPVQGLLPREKANAGKPGGRKKQQQKAGPRRFRSRQGFEILSGRSSRENDRLTLTVARGNDLFFHRAHQPGPHVILRVPPGKVAAPESIEDASFLAGYLAGWRGPANTMVHWCPTKYIRKPKGLPPGKVLLDRPREFLVRYQPELLEKLTISEPAP